VKIRRKLDRAKIVAFGVHDFPPHQVAIAQPVLNPRVLGIETLGDEHIAQAEGNPIICEMVDPQIQVCSGLLLVRFTRWV
jgi:hypothetical protein